MSHLDYCRPGARQRQTQAGVLDRFRTVSAIWGVGPFTRRALIQRAGAIAFLCQLGAICGCARSEADPPPRDALPIVLVSSSDFGCVASNRGGISRLVALRNHSDGAARVAHWAVSCDCLTVEPTSLDIAPEGTAFIRLTYDHNDGTVFTGDLVISVDGFVDGEHTCNFGVPIRIVSSDELPTSLR